MEELKKGYICKYSFDNENRSVAIVEIVRILDDSRGIAEIKFLHVIVDDTGNGLFEYLLRTGKTMYASIKYLQKMRLRISCGESMPAADVVPVVRCKDCIWSRKVNDKEPMYRCVNICRYGCTQWLDSVDFCSYGERKDGDTA